MNYDADVLKFKHPFTFCIVGPTGCGKTVFVILIYFKFIKKRLALYLKRFYIFFSIWQPLLTDILKDNPHIQF